MVDVASIAIAIVSLVTSALVVGLSSWLAYTIDKHKATRDEEKVLRKYRDPLALASHDLQARLYNIVSNRGLYLANTRDQRDQDSLYIYTLFLVGQFLAWSHILRQRAQFSAFTAGNGSNKRIELIKLLDEITKAFNDDKPYDEPGKLVKSHQMAIGEIMTVRDGVQGELLCMGFSAFTKRWKAEESLVAGRGHGDQSPTPDHAVYPPDDQSQEINLLPFEEASAKLSDLTKDLPLHTWFGPIREIIDYLVEEYRDGNRDLHGKGARLRKLQGLLLELVKELSPEIAKRPESKVTKDGARLKPKERASTNDPISV